MREAGQLRMQDALEIARRHLFGRRRQRDGQAISRRTGWGTWLGRHLASSCSADRRRATQYMCWPAFMAMLLRVMNVAGSPQMNAIRTGNLTRLAEARRNVLNDLRLQHGPRRGQGIFVARKTGDTVLTVPLGCEPVRRLMAL